MLFKVLLMIFSHHLPASIAFVCFFFFPHKLAATKTLDADETQTPCDTKRITRLADKPFVRCRNNHTKQSSWTGQTFESCKFKMVIMFKRKRDLTFILHLSVSSVDVLLRNNRYVHIHLLPIWPLKCIMWSPSGAFVFERRLKPWCSTLLFASPLFTPALHLATLPSCKEKKKQSLTSGFFFFLFSSIPWCCVAEVT